MTEEKDKYDLSKGKTVCNWCDKLIAISEVTITFKSVDGKKFLSWRGCYSCYLNNKTFLNK